MRIIGMLALLLFSSLAWAAEPNGASGVFTVPNMDQSVLYLSEIFGQVGSIIGGASNGPLEGAILLFNNVALVLGGFVILYAIVVSTVNTAHDGELLGKKWSSVWIPIRMAGGFALLLPAKVGGYAICQVLIMWLVVQGVGAADYVWGMYLKNVEIGNATSQTPYISQGVMKSVTQIFMNAACTAAAPSAAAQTQYTPSTGVQQLNLPGIVQSGNNIVFGFTNPSKPSECGSVALNPVPAPNNTGASQGATFNGYGSFQDAMAAQRAIMQNQVLSATVQTLSKTATYYVQKSNYCNGNADKSCVNDVQRQIINAANNFSAQMTNANSSNFSAVKQINVQGQLDSDQKQTLQNLSFSNSGNAAVMSDISQASQYGWLYAGTYYILLSKLTTQTSPQVDAPKLAMPSQSDIISTYMSTSPFSYIQQITRVCSGSSPQANNVSQSLQNNNATVIPCIPKDLNVSGPAATLKMANVSSSGNTSGAGASMVGAISDGMQDTFNGFITQVLSASTNPVMALAAFGQHTLMATMMIFLDIAAGISVAGALAGAVPAIFNSSLFDALTTMLQFVALPVFGLMGLIAGFSAMVGYYLPLVPYILFTAGTIAWFILVIEAMIAGPIMALGIVHPEGGHDIWGHSSKGMMLLISVFLRPTLMIIGFIAASLLVYVAFQILNGGFSVAIAFLGASYFGPIAFIFCLMIYGTTAVYLMHQCFKLVHKLPDQVLRWVGEQADASGQEADAEVGRGGDKASGLGDSGGKGAATKMKDNIGRAQQAKGMEDELGNEKSKESSGDDAAQNNNNQG